MSNELDIVRPDATFAELMEKATAICKSGLVPKSLNTPEAVYVAIQTGTEAGLSPMAAVRSVYVIGGSPAWKGEAALALIRKSGAAKALDVGAEKVGTTDEDVRGFARWIDADGLEREVVYTVADAKRAKLWGKAGPWSEHPKDMLMWRAVGRAAKRFFSEVLLGLDVAEVARDYRQEERPTPPPPTEPDPLLEAAAAGPSEAPVIDVEPVEKEQGTQEARSSAAGVVSEGDASPAPTEERGDPSQLTPEEQAELGLGSS